MCVRRARRTFTDSSNSTKTHAEHGYTINDLRAAIPAHCFQSNTIVSACYIGFDLACAALLAVASSRISGFSGSTTRLLLWTIYGFAQGLVFTALWNLAHEAGHGALSKHKWFNHGVGMIIHTCLLTPYHSWRYTHQTHHKNTNNLAMDIAFIPPTRQQHAARAKQSSVTLPFHELIEDTPIATLLFLVFYQLLAWPCYLLLNNSSLERIRCYPWWKRSHLYFGGDGPSFARRHFWGVVASDAAIAVFLCFIWSMSKLHGFSLIFKLWGVPFLWTNHWMLVIVYCQHVDPRLPYYDASSFSFLRGAAATIDRDFGFLGRHFSHGAINYHVVHHHFCTIPFYHAREATAAIQKVMGAAYVSDVETNWLWAFWNYQRICKFVDVTSCSDTGNAVYYFTS